MSSNLGPQVKVEKDDGLKNQWLKGAFYRKEGSKLVFKSERGKLIAMISVSLLVIAMFFKDVPDEEVQKNMSIDSPDRVSDYQPDLTLNSYSDTKIIKKTKQ